MNFWKMKYLNCSDVCKQIFITRKCALLILYAHTAAVLRLNLPKNHNSMLYYYIKTHFFVSPFLFFVPFLPFKKYIILFFHWKIDSVLRKNKGLSFIFAKLVSLFQYCKNIDKYKANDQQKFEQKTSLLHQTRFCTCIIILLL